MGTQTRNILYIHGMGGGGDSRIPSILKEHINDVLDPSAGLRLEVVVRAYSFDPETAWGQISSWVEELHPVLIAGESLGALNAIKIRSLPHVLVSPSLNAILHRLRLCPGSHGCWTVFSSRKMGTGRSCISHSAHFPSTGDSGGKPCPILRAEEALTPSSPFSEDATITGKAAS